MATLPQSDILKVPGQLYRKFHARRYAYLLEQVDCLFNCQFGHPWNILDIGPSFQTAMLREKYPAATIDSAGFQDHRFPSRQHETHFEMNLNDVDLPDLREYDMVLLAEVIEHLYAPPVRVLTKVSRWLKPGGSIIIQTPNPISLGKRFHLLAGYSPFEVIRDDPRNPGHFCEYTVNDLKDIARNAGLEVFGVWAKNYFGPAGSRNLLYDIACFALPGHLQDGITAVLRKPFPKL